MFINSSELPSFFMNNASENTNIFSFEEDNNCFTKSNQINTNFFPQAKAQGENPGSYTFQFLPDSKLEVPQNPSPLTEVCQKAPAFNVDPIDAFVETREVTNSQGQQEEAKFERPKKKSSKRKTTDFAYLLERKSFRMMRKYYKEKFEFEIEDPEYKKKLPKMSTCEINTLVSDFMIQELGPILICLLSQNDFDRIRDALKTIIFWDRYAKKEAISEGLSFVSLRNVLHKYNTRNLIDFLSDASYSFLYTHFFLKEGKKAATEQTDNDADKLLARMRHLMKESANYLPTEINKIFEEIHSSIFE